MAGRRMAVLFLMVATVALVAVGLAQRGALQAQSQSQGNDLVGLWYFSVSVPGGQVTGFTNFHAGGTMSQVRNVDEGTLLLPPPLPGRRTTSHQLGIWQRAGNGFEFLWYLMAYDYFTGDPALLTRVRSVVTLDPPRFDTGTGLFSLAQWECPGGICPDPTDPSVPQPPEIGAGPDGRPTLPWTLRRIRIR